MGFADVPDAQLSRCFAVCARRAQNKKLRNQFTLIAQ
jgi:hypothetical protein